MSSSQRVDPDEMSQAELFVHMTDEEQADVLGAMTEKKKADLAYDWSFHGRPKQQAPAGVWLIWLILAGRGFGKALDVDTPIPTVDGWTTMLDVRVGDVLFDENGRQCRVTLVSPVYLNRDCYRLTFSDGSSIVADADHEWATIDRRTRKSIRRRKTDGGSGIQIVTTEKIAGSLYDGREVNHSIQCAGPLEIPETALPVDPYVLGVWLGDGSSATAELTTGDSEILVHLAQAGCKTGEGKPNSPKSDRHSMGTAPLVRDPVTGRMMPNGSLHSALRRMGLIGNKHVPTSYLRSSERQRLALLQGFMDTDGCVDRFNGTCEFTNTRKGLAEAVFELCCSLGIKPTLTEGRAMLNGRDCGPKYRVHFTAYRPVFRLSRKRSLQKPPRSQADRQRRRYIVEATRVPSVPVRCIQVDSPSHLFLAGRAMIPTHNTRTGAEITRAWAESGLVSRITITGPTADDIRDAMIEGESGLLAVSRKNFWPLYQPAKRRVEWPNGCIGTIISADEPDRFRNKQHEKVWADEIAAWRYLASAWAMMMFGLRLGRPQIVATTTPRPLPLIKKLVATAEKTKNDPNRRVVVTRGSSYENMVNLAPEYVESVIEPYVGTELGRQEIEAEILDETKGALWTLKLIEDGRVENVLGTDEMSDDESIEKKWGVPIGLARTKDDKPIEVPQLLRVVVAVDPSVAILGDKDECGIVVAGVGWCDCLVKKGGKRGLHLFVLDDLSGHMSPDAWAQTAVNAYRTYNADLIVGEINQGGGLVETNIRAVDGAEDVPYESVYAHLGKRARAEPVSTLYKKGKAHHVGTFRDLEDEMTSWVPLSGLPSPNRLDALVWAGHQLLLEEPEEKTAAQNWAEADPANLVLDEDDF